MPEPPSRQPVARRGAARATAGGLALIVLLAACARPAPPAASATPHASAGGTSSPSAVPSSPDRLRLAEVADGLDTPIGITNANDGSGRLFVNEQDGRVRVIEPDGSLDPDPFLDISDRVLAGGERGFLGLAFHPDFEHNGRLFVHYSRAGDGATIVSEMQAAPDLRSADPGSERVLLSLAQPFANHNGGQLAFGPEGDLYIGLGDGGSSGDPLGNGQNPDVLLGKLLRIDVDAPHAAGLEYALPPDNPYGPDGIRPGGGRPEIWAIGLRNPWRFSFDPETGDLYIGDVGQSSWEEIDRQTASSRGGENYGWNVMEGDHCYQSSDCDRSRFVEPITEYSHEFGCSVTGGFVYRGDDLPDLVGTYVFADYCSGIVFTLRPDAGTAPPRQVLDTEFRITAFGTDQDGELYLADAGGTIQRVGVEG
jgi:glucose/arabinose dehydrogenase